MRNPLYAPKDSWRWPTSVADWLVWLFFIVGGILLIAFTKGLVPAFAVGALSLSLLAIQWRRSSQSSAAD